MTNMNDDGDYPLPDNFEEEQLKKFEEVWRNHLSFHPLIASLPYERREKAKALAETAYRAAMPGLKEIQRLLTIAYNDGDKDGMDYVRNRLRDKLNDLMCTLDE